MSKLDHFITGTIFLYCENELVHSSKITEKLMNINCFIKQVKYFKFYKRASLLEYMKCTMRLI